MTRALAPVFIAGSLAEIDFVEKLLDSEGIEYSVRPQESIHNEHDKVCLQGLLFEVLEDRAVYCRKLIEERGLGRGVVPPGTDL